jgi:hypothetical protein
LVGYDVKTQYGAKYAKIKGDRFGHPLFLFVHVRSAIGAEIPIIIIAIINEFTNGTCLFITPFFPRTLFPVIFPVQHVQFLQDQLFHVIRTFALTTFPILNGAVGDSGQFGKLMLGQSVPDPRIFDGIH